MPNERLRRYGYLQYSTQVFKSSIDRTTFAIAPQFKESADAKPLGGQAYVRRNSWKLFISPSLYVSSFRSRSRACHKVVGSQFLVKLIILYIIDSRGRRRKRRSAAAAGNRSFGSCRSPLRQLWTEITRRKKRKNEAFLLKMKLIACPDKQ